MKTYRVKKGGEYLDKIVFKEYGFIGGAIEKVLDDNRDVEGRTLSSYGVFLPEEIVIKLPVVEKEEPSKTFTLFG